MQERRVSQRRACVLAHCPRASVQYRPRKRSDAELIAQLRELQPTNTARCTAIAGLPFCCGAITK